MSYIGLNPAQLGLLIPQDPLTGLLRVDLMLVFDLLSSVTWQQSGQVARHPIQSGREGPSDAILEEPERVSITASFVDKPLSTGLIPAPTPIVQPDRCLMQAQALSDLKARRQLLTAVVPGRVFADRAISTLDVTPSPDGGEVEVQLTLDHVRVVSLGFTGAIADAQSKALGQQVVEFGYG
ncbi:MAG: hypothetical protein E6Q97_36935 [Desulfurellales bacterium]|nr:MAG: hypothetical protein E6Q97_36935 [Desulfurellales bacterium]